MEEEKKILQMTLFNICSNFVGKNVEVFGTGTLAGLPSPILERVQWFFSPHGLHNISDVLADAGIDSETVWKEHFRRRWGDRLLKKHENRQQDDMTLLSYGANSFCRPCYRQLYIDRHYVDVLVLLTSLHNGQNTLACDPVKKIQECSGLVGKDKMTVNEKMNKTVEKVPETESKTTYSEAIKHLRIYSKYVQTVSIMNRHWKFLWKEEDIISTLADSVQNVHFLSLSEGTLKNSQAAIIKLICGRNVKQVWLERCHLELPNFRLLLECCTGLSRLHYNESKFLKTSESDIDSFHAKNEDKKVIRFQTCQNAEVRSERKENGFRNNNLKSDIEGGFTSDITLSIQEPIIIIPDLAPEPLLRFEPTDLRAQTNENIFPGTDPDQQVLSLREDLSLAPQSVENVTTSCCSFKRDGPSFNIDTTMSSSNFKTDTSDSDIELDVVNKETSAKDIDLFDLAVSSTTKTDVASTCSSGVHLATCTCSDVSDYTRQQETDSDSPSEATKEYKRRKICHVFPELSECKNCSNSTCTLFQNSDSIRKADNERKIREISNIGKPAVLTSDDPDNITKTIITTHADKFSSDCHNSSVLRSSSSKSPWRNVRMTPSDPNGPSASTSQGNPDGLSCSTSPGVTSNLLEENIGSRKHGRESLVVIFDNNSDTKAEVDLICKKILPKWKSLKRLGLIFSFFHIHLGATQFPLTEVLEAISQHQLTHLLLESCCRHDNFFQNLLGVLSQEYICDGSSRPPLYLLCCRMGPEVISCPVHPRFTGKINGIVRLNLSGSEFDESGITGLTQLVSHDLALRHLNLNSCTMPSDGIYQIFTALQMNATIEELRVKEISIDGTEDGCLSLVSFLQNVQSLQELDATESCSTSNLVGSTEFIQTVVSHRSLRSLVIAVNNLRKSALALLEGVLLSEKAPTMRKLDIGYNQIQGEDIMDIIDRLVYKQSQERQPSKYPVYLDFLDISGNMFNRKLQTVLQTKLPAIARTFRVDCVDFGVPLAEFQAQM